MNKLIEKLRSKTGSSLILALMFMLICTFVGGAVLASATANGGRLAQARQRHQDYLSQRSVAQILVDQLTLPGQGENARNRLSIGSVVTVTTQFDVTDLATEISQTTTASIEATAPLGQKNPLHKILYEASVRAYLENQSKNEADAVNLETSYFEFGTLQSPASISDYYPSSGSFTVKLSRQDGLDTTVLEETVVYYTCSIKSENLCTFEFTFDDPNATPKTENGQLKVVLEAHVNSQRRVEVRWSESTATKIEKTSYVSNITWEEPEIRKGGDEDIVE